MDERADSVEKDGALDPTGSVENNTIRQDKIRREATEFSSSINKSVI